MIIWTQGAVSNPWEFIGSQYIANYITTSLFTGVEKAEMLTGGDTVLHWDTSDPSFDSVKIYVREASSDVFSDTYWIQTVKYTLGKFIIGMNADGVSYLEVGKTYYVGIKGLNSGTPDGNTNTIAFSVTQNNVHFKLPVNIVSM